MDVVIFQIRAAANTRALMSDRGAGETFESTYGLTFESASIFSNIIMGPVKFTRVVSCSSEDPNQPAENLIKDGTYRKWRCKSNGEQRIWVELELEKNCILNGLDIGNNGSAFVEVLAGRTGFSESEYKVVLNSSSFMSPQESRNETNQQRVRMFRAQELNKVTLSEKWDRIRVVCTQPFNHHVKYGLSFITVHTEEDSLIKVVNKTPAALLSDVDLGMFKLKDEPTTDAIKQGTVFSRFRTSAWNSSSKTTPGAIRAASQSLAEVALAESEMEARSALKPSPLKADRPVVNLTEKLKESRVEDGQPGPSSVTKRILAEDSKLPSRKVVEGRSPKPSKVDGEKRKEIKSEYPGGRRKDAPSSNGANHLKETTSTPKEKRKASSASLTPKREEAERPAKKLRLTKPFNKLLEGVVVVLSGFQNPLRSQLRDKLLAMGAKYKPEWNPQCTHLVSAFANTPKFREVKGKGKIVTKDWVDQCYSQRKRLPWRRFHLDRDDKGPESEEEIWAGNEIQRGPVSSKPAPDKAVTSAQKQSEGKNTEIQDQQPVKNTAHNDEDVEDYGGSTDVDDPDTEDEIELVRNKLPAEEMQKRPTAPDYSRLELPKLPNFFRGFVFSVRGDFSPEIRQQIVRYVTAFDGKIVDDIGPTVSHVITNQWGDTLAKVRKENSNIKFLRPEWIWECSQSQKWMPPERYEVEPTR